MIEYTLLSRQDRTMHFRVFRRPTVLKTTTLRRGLPPERVVDLKCIRTKQLLSKRRHGQFLTRALNGNKRLGGPRLPDHGAINVDATDPTRDHTGVNSPKTHQ